MNKHKTIIVIALAGAAVAIFLMHKKSVVAATPKPTGQAGTTTSTLPTTGGGVIGQIGSVVTAANNSGLASTLGNIFSGIFDSSGSTDASGAMDESDD